LYIGDFGSASSNLQKARRIKMTDTRLLLGQAIIFLRRGDTKRALQYYLDVKDYEPSNKIADKAIEFIRHNNDFDEICRYFETGKIQQFYPPLGPNPHKKFYVIVPVVAFILGAAITFCFIPKQNYNGKRKNLEALALTSVEKENLQEKDLTSQSFNYILSSKDISKSYKNAIDYFQSGNDNLAQREINRLLNSNASFSIKQKCQVLMSYLEVPTFDSLKDNFSYKQVAEEPLLYLDCWVVWSGRLSNSTVNPDGSYSCQLLVGYENMKTVDGIVNVHFDKEPALLSDQAVKILGQIDFEDSNVVLKGKAVYQSVKK
jgi:tetratricopeptide (TPR) repeat protein